MYCPITKPTAKTIPQKQKMEGEASSFDKKNIPTSWRIHLKVSSFVYRKVLYTFWFINRSLSFKILLMSYKLKDNPLHKAWRDVVDQYNPYKTITNGKIIIMRNFWKQVFELTVDPKGWPVSHWANFLVGSWDPRPFGVTVAATPIFSPK